MKAERIITNLEQYIRLMPTVEKDTIETCLKNKIEPTDISLNIIYNLLTEARAEAINEKAKSNGLAGMKKAAGRILKEAGKGCSITIEKPCITEDHKYIFCDGSRLIESPDSFGYELNENNSFAGSAKKFFDQVENDTDYKETTDLPTPKYLTEYARTCKEQGKTIGYKKTVLYDFGEDMPGFNAEYLRDILEAVGNNAVMKYKSLVSMVEFVGNNGRAILMPIKKI